jgi:hypothetical protein
MTWSLIRRIPRRRQIYLTPGIRLSCGGITLPARVMGSVTIAAIASEPWTKNLS